jgi:hypothetical protein
MLYLTNWTLKPLPSEILKYSWRCLHNYFNFLVLASKRLKTLSLKVLTLFLLYSGREHNSFLSKYLRFGILKIGFWEEKVDMVADERLDISG